MRRAPSNARIGLIGLAVIPVLLAGCGAGGAPTSSEIARLQQEADMRQIEHIEVTFHKAASTKDVDLMMSLYADDATVTFGGKTYTGKDQIRGFFSKAGPFQLGNHWVSDTPAYKMKVTVDKDTGTLYFECHYINADNETVAVVVGADQHVARIQGKWLITELIAATPKLTP
jgi:ketosteroid isomerase-like protein